MECGDTKRLPSLVAARWRSRLTEKARWPSLSACSATRGEACICWASSTHSGRGGVKAEAACCGCCCWGAASAAHARQAVSARESAMPPVDRQPFGVLDGWTSSHQQSQHRIKPELHPQYELSGERSRKNRRALKRPEARLGLLEAHKVLMDFRGIVSQADKETGVPREVVAQPSEGRGEGGHGPIRATRASDLRNDSAGAAVLSCTRGASVLRLLLLLLLLLLLHIRAPTCRNANEYSNAERSSAVQQQTLRVPGESPGRAGPGTGVPPGSHHNGFPAPPGYATPGRPAGKSFLNIL
ncbi:Phosphate acyltransferase [Frankliniella fusca]|uniref:Phosphate acyltransferase n=1 Tax=Frankliniella fusca TaxID=407009 RepID=A0AAE1H8S2_9NEOP|nr:Phosphate acyltransferase [Frankliniella fusca]